MSYARDMVYSFANTLAKMARQAVSRNPQDHAAYLAIEGGSDEDLYLHGLLNRVEDDRAHAEAEKLREKVKLWGLPATPRAEDTARAWRTVADEIDPYEERDGQLVRKDNGKPVVL